MDANLPALLLLQIMPVFSNYALVTEPLTWANAQQYCRQQHTDLAEINYEQELNAALEAIGSESGVIWIGLERSSTSQTDWAWSSGEVVQTFFWAEGQPNSNEQWNGGMLNGKWHDDYSYSENPFLCSTTDLSSEIEALTQAMTTAEAVDLMTEKMTWEEALDYCKNAGKKLASPRDSADLTLIGIELSQMDQGELVWMGLRFLAGVWLWYYNKRSDWLRTEPVIESIKKTS